MKITEVFVNEMEKIEEAVKNLPMENCIANFDDYLNAKEVTSTVEKDFIKALDKDLSRFVLNIRIKQYSDKSNVELLDTIKDFMLNGYYSIYDDVSDNCLTDLLYGYSDVDVFPKIKDYMNVKLTELKDEYKKSGKDKRKETLVKQIEQYERTIKVNNDTLENLRKQLENIQ